MFAYLQQVLFIGSLITIFSVPVHAATLTFESFSGSLSADNDVSRFNFTVNNPARVGIRTLSYGGGRLADGTEISPGGFDPILTLFDSSNTSITNNDDGDGRVDPRTHEAYDSRIVRFLNPGTYTVAVSQYDHFYDLDQFPARSRNFTTTYGCSAGQFCDVTGDSRTNRWVAEVPESSTILGSGLTLGLLAILRCQQLRKKT
ncbi:DVUA0089 family protein [Acaryochloris sp. IP29b_bin.148]|uniref:DVUA0089 family protein n=1 Tax=Acaryochloris sp. IP29b_bin.148 TaxID=2969218 RepID=UPI00262DA16D|nr:DVUA0089 family protein [Acaryochloris sp. IP29b_bin.148]